MEYKQFAQYYDKFYQNKQYGKEVVFLDNVLKGRTNILDVGCGTGIHAHLLQNLGYKVDIVDLNKEMLEIARTRVTGDAFNQNMLELDLEKKYDAIISMFAVINHLSDIKQVEKVLSNFKENLRAGGRIVIDLHNPQNSGEKEDCVGDIKRKMMWAYDSERKIEDTVIEFEVDGNKYEDSHRFRIFSIAEIIKVCQKINLVTEGVYENYTFDVGNKKSKNLQFVLRK